MSWLRHVFDQLKESASMPAAEASSSAGPSRVRQLHLGHASDVGLVRPHNEDASLVVESVFEGDQAAETVGLFIVADGMGGHQAGEVASALAARMVALSLMQQVYIPYLRRAAHQSDQLPLNEALQQAVEAANQ